MEKGLRRLLVEDMQEDVYLNVTMGIKHRNKDGTYTLETPDHDENFNDINEWFEYCAEQLQYMKKAVADEYGEDIAEIVCNG